MELLFVSFVAGLLTVLAPCVLPVLPVVIGGSLLDRDRLRPYIVTGSLALSIVVFTLLLKGTTFLIDVPLEFWKTVSAGIILAFGVVTLFPFLWEKFETVTGLGAHSQGLLCESGKKGGRLGAVFVGAALGPVFTSCSPTYGIILATVLPQNFFVGVVHLLAYAFGLAVVLLIVAIFGQRAIARMRWVADPRGVFKRGLGALMIVVGLAVFFGWDKRAETLFLDWGYGDVTWIEERLLQEDTR